MDLDPSATLQKIINNDGHCEWATPAICQSCPLGNKFVNGRRVNCWDYISSRFNLTIEQTDQIAEAYKRAAEDELFAMELEKSLT